MLMMFSVLRADTLSRGVWDQCGDQERHCRVVWAGGDQGEGGEIIVKFFSTTLKVNLPESSSAQQVTRPFKVLVSLFLIFLQCYLSFFNHSWLAYCWIAQILELPFNMVPWLQFCCEKWKLGWTLYFRLSWNRFSGLTRTSPPPATSRRQSRATTKTRWAQNLFFSPWSKRRMYRPRVWGLDMSYELHRHDRQG